MSESWTNFVREMESIEHARKTITAPTPMELDAFQGNCHKCGKCRHTAKECRSWSHGGAEKPQCAQCGKKHHGQWWTRSYTSSHKDSQKGGWKGDSKRNGKGTRKSSKFKGGKGGNHGKGKRLDEITEPPEQQWTGGSWEQWSEQSWNDEANTASWRDDDCYTADSNSQTAAAEELQHASVGDLRLSIFGFVKNVESFQPGRLNLSQRTIIFGVDTAASKTVVLASHPAARGYLVHKDTWMCV